MTKPVIDISAVLVSYNTAALLPDAIGALRIASEGFSFQTIIIDNASRDDSVALIQRDFPDCDLIVNLKNVGFGRANNQSLHLIQGRYVLLLNTDAFVAPDTLSKTVAYMDSHPKCGAVGVRLVGRDGVPQPACRNFPTPLNIFLARTGLHRMLPWVRMVDEISRDHATSRPCDWVPGCYFLIRSEVIAQIGFFDPRYFLYYEEVDFCFSAKKAGWEVHYFPHTTVVHIGGESAKSEGELTSGGRQIESMQIESEMLYFRKNYGMATVFLNVFLHTLADFIVPLKSMLKLKKKVNWSRYWLHCNLVWKIYTKTSFGSFPIR